MKYRSTIIAFALFVVAPLVGIAVAAIDAPAVAAECPANDLYCQGWTPADQALKVRRQTLDYIIANHAWTRDCNDVTVGAEFNGTTCIQNYNNSTGGLLFTFADHNRFDRVATVRAAIALTYDWGYGFERLYGRPPTPKDWALHYPWGWGDFAVATRSNNPMAILNADGSLWCVTQEYNGVCPGRW